MKILVTGDAGLIGRDVSAALMARGDDVIGFDKSRNEDLLDHKLLEEAAAGCKAIVHCAAIKNDSRGTLAEIFATNVTGTWNALRAAERGGATTFVYLSTAQVFGVYDPTPPALDVPITDNHPRHATRPYGLSKCFGEDLCASFTSRTGLTTVVLRPVAVFDPPTYEWAWGERVTFAARSWQDRAFVDVRDVSAAALLAIDRPPSATHVRLTLCSPHLIPGADPNSSDPNSSRTGFETSAAASVLGWRPWHTWDEFVLTKTDTSRDPSP